MFVHMEQYQNPRVVGACLIGFAVVGGTYLFTNFGQSNFSQTTGLYAVAADAPLRYPIDVKDSLGDGVEDWRDQFISAPPIDLDTSGVATVYVKPDTLTEQLGVNLMEGFFASMGAAPLRPRERVVADTVKNLERIASSDRIYDVRDIQILRDSSDEAVRQYGNALALLILSEPTPGLDNELVLLRDYLELKDEKYLKDLIRIANIYKKYRDETLLIPVPAIYAKEHLDLINVFNALYNNIDTMAKAETDPMLPFLRLKRYEEDVMGLALALKNMYDAVVTRASAFSEQDPAVLFITFNYNL